MPAEPIAFLQAASPAVPNVLLLLVVAFLSLVAVLVAATILLASAVPASLFVVVLETVAAAGSVVLQTCDVVLQVSLVLLVLLAGVVPVVPVGTASVFLLVSARAAHVAQKFHFLSPPAVVSWQSVPHPFFLCCSCNFSRCNIAACIFLLSTAAASAGAAGGCFCWFCKSCCCMVCNSWCSCLCSSCSCR